MMTTKRLDLTGQTFGTLTVLRDSQQKRSGRRMVDCQCSCGVLMAAEPRDLRRGHVLSCGCERRLAVGRASKLRARHGMTRKTEHMTWIKMRGRCYNKADKTYHRYGGRGITVCDAWRNSFESFLADMGPKPFPKASIDRIDNDGPYSPENCRWADLKTQARNKRGTRRVTHEGRTIALAEACELTGVKYTKALYRLNKGVPWESIVAA